MLRFLPHLLKYLEFRCLRWRRRLRNSNTGKGLGSGILEKLDGDEELMPRGNQPLVGVKVSEDKCDLRVILVKLGVDRQLIDIVAEEQVATDFVPVSSTVPPFCLPAAPD